MFHDDFGAAQAATAHMLQKGRRKPGYLGVTLLDKAVGLARREGFDSALRDAGLVPQPQRMSIAKFNMESGYHQAEQLNQWLDFSNRFCGYSVQRYGAIDSYPTIDQL